MQSFESKVAVITGGGNGIGRALARQLSGRGCRIVLADIDEAALAESEQALKEAGAEVATALTDVTDATAVEALARTTLERFGQVDIVVNNAGVIAWNPMSALTLQDWEWVVGVNLWGVIHGIHAFLPIITQQGTEGHFVNLSSVGGILADTPFMATYSATKGAVIGLSLTLAKELEAAGVPIGVTIVCPSATRDTGADRAERNRPVSAPQPPRAPGVDGLTDLVHQSVVKGQPVELLAARVAEAIRDNRLWAFPNPDAGPMVRPRLAVLDGVLREAETQTRDH
jgi:NAD(P)-dependent dehydrogenase (short-subunit alcohol dehydrogenase family)